MPASRLDAGSGSSGRSTTGGGSDTGGSRDTVTPPTPEPSSSFPIVPWVITGGLAVGAGIFGGLALSASSDLSTAKDTPNAKRATLDDLESKTTTLALVTDIFAGATVVAGVVSIYLTVKHTSSTTGSSAPPMRVAVTPRGVALAGGF